MEEMGLSSPVGSPLRKELEQAPQLMQGFSTIFGSADMDEVVKPKMASTVVIAFLYFKAPLDVANVRSVLEDRLCKLLRFRSKVKNMAKDGKRMVLAWERLPDSSLKVALRDIIREKQGIKTQADVDKFVSDEYQQGWDPNLPWWRAYVINNMADGRSMLMMKIHHAIGDGVALVEVLMSVLDDKPMMPVPSRRSIRNTSSGGGLACVSGCITQMKGLLQACWGPLIGDQLPADPPNRLKTKDPRKPGRTKACYMTGALSIERVRLVQRTIPGATINDVLMTVTAMTLQEYFRKYEPTSLGQKVRANFPINIRSVTGSDIMTDEHFGNRFSQGMIRFPLSFEDPLQVFQNIKNQIDVIKASPEPYVRDKIIGLVSLRSGLPFDMVTDLVLDAFGKVTAMLSNVPGPLEQVNFLEQPLDDLCFYAMAPIGLYFGIVQYNGAFKAGICCDTACEPEPKKLGECWETAFERLYSRVVTDA